MSVASRAAEVLAGQGELAGAVVERLVELLATPDDSFVASRAAEVLAGQGELAGAVVERLVELAVDGSSFAYHALWSP
jgi:HEAT repeat protein